MPNTALNGAFSPGSIYGNQQVASPPAGSSFPKVTRSDYAANAGGMLSKQPLPNGVENSAGPSSIADFADWSTNPTRDGPKCYNPSDSHYATGVVYQYSTIRVKDILDGTSKTYAVGEKFLLIDKYGSGDDPADNEWLFVGYDNDTNRSAQPITGNAANVIQDTFSSTVINGFTMGGPNDFYGRNFWGSAHRNTMNMVFCDGSVHTVPYTIDATVHMQLANRKDGADPKFDY